MKKILCILTLMLVLVCMLVACQSPSLPEETTETIPEEPFPTSQGLAYRVNNNGKTCTITGIGTCTDNDIYIGGYIDGYKVTTISYTAFEYCTKLTSVTIGNSVTTIGTYAFRNCTNLTSVTIGDSVTIIGIGAFKDCSKLMNVYIHDTATWCNIDFGDSYANPLSIAQKFYLIKDGFPELITDFVIPDSVTTIDHDAFEYCSNLTSITIPDSVTTISRGAFSGCSKLTNIIVDVNNETYQSIDGNLYSKDGTVLVAYASGKTDTSFSIPDSVTVIGEEAFWNCDNLTSVTIGDSVTIIDMWAFENCSKLTNVTIGNSVTTIGAWAFMDCDNLTNVTIGDSVGTIGVLAFYNCSNLTSITIPDSVTTINEGAFSSCSNLTNIIVDEKNETYQSIDGNLYSKDGTVLVAYASGKTDTGFTIPDFVTIIGVEAFWNCDNLTSITIGDSVTAISEDAFLWCSNLTSITIPDSVTAIGRAAFAGCTSLESVTFANPNGWWYAEDADATSGTAIFASDFSNPATAAQYLRSTYDNYYWFRAE